MDEMDENKQTKLISESVIKRKEKDNKEAFE